MLDQETEQQFAEISEVIRSADARIIELLDRVKVLEKRLGEHRQAIIDAYQEGFTDARGVDIFSTEEFSECFAQSAAIQFVAVENERDAAALNAGERDV